MTYYYLAVWSGEKTISNREAAKHYAALLAGNTSQTFSESVYSFCSDLASRYPNVDLLTDEEMESCPWACAPEISGCHVILALLPDRHAGVFSLILQLADKHGLICFDPQNSIVHLPSYLRIAELQ